MSGDPGAMSEESAVPYFRYLHPDLPTGLMLRKWEHYLMMEHVLTVETADSFTFLGPRVFMKVVTPGNCAAA